MKRRQPTLELIEKEHQRKLKDIELIASENIMSGQVIEAMGSYAEGYPSKRYYGGCQVVEGRGPYKVKNSYHLSLFWLFSLIYRVLASDNGLFTCHFWSLLVTSGHFADSLAAPKERSHGLGQMFQAVETVLTRPLKVANPPT